MQRIRIKKVPIKGDQRDYSLYDKTTLNPNYQDSSIAVQNTMGPVDRSKATVEVERGEVVIGDTNNDGFLELFTFTGKPHSKGGTPVDIPEGSFIFSNTAKLRIKDEELLKSQFGLPMKKGGWTPAEIANKYQINEYIADLKSPDTDNLTKRSSDQMLKKNMEKLGILALIQESMKGFPDGVPAIAESVMAGLIGDQQLNTGLNGQLGKAPAQPPPPASPQELMQASQQQEMQEMPQDEMMEPMQEAPEQEAPMQRYGGLTKFAGGGPAPKYKVYPGEKPIPTPKRKLTQAEIIARGRAEMEKMYEEDYKIASKNTANQSAASNSKLASVTNKLESKLNNDVDNKIIPLLQSADKAYRNGDVEQATALYNQAKPLIDNAKLYKAQVKRGHNISFNNDMIRNPKNNLYPFLNYGSNDNQSIADIEYLTDRDRMVNLPGLSNRAVYDDPAYNTFWRNGNFWEDDKLEQYAYLESEANRIKNQQNIVKAPPKQSAAKQPKATKEELSNVGITFQNANTVIENYQKQYAAAKAEGNHQKMEQIGTAMINYSKNIQDHHEATPWYSMGWMYGSDENAYQGLAGTTYLTGNQYMLEAANVRRVANIEKHMQSLVPVAQEIQKRINANDPNVTADEYKKLEKISKMYKSWNEMRQYDDNKKAFVPQSASVGWTPGNMTGPPANVYSYLSGLENKLNNLNSSKSSEIASKKQAEADSSRLGTAFADYSDTSDMLSVPVVQQPYDSEETATTGSAATPAQAPAQTAPPQQTAARPKQRTAPAVYTHQNVLDEYAFGGSLPKYVKAGSVQETKTNPLVLAEKPKDAVTSKPDPNALVKIDEKEIIDQNGQKVKVDIFVKGDMVYAIDANGNTVSSKKRSEYTNYGNSQYGDQRIQGILNKAKNVDYSGVNFGEFGTQRQNPNSAIYVQSNDAAYRKKNDLTPEEWADFQRRHGDWLDKEYVSFAGNGNGFEAFKKDLMTSPTVGNKAAGWFQDTINKYSREKFGEDYYTTTGDSAYARDSKFGRVTYSTPRFWDEDVPETNVDPEMDTAYYCVKDENGQGSVQTVSFKKGEQPIAPTGSVVTRYYSAEDATANCGGGEVKKPGVKEMFYCVKGPNNLGNVVSVTYNEGEQPTPPPGAVASYETRESADAGCSTPRIPKKGGWWLPDVVNYAGVATDEINRYEPTLEQINARTPGYVLMDPTRQLAANQSDMASYRRMAENTASGNVALASALGASGEGFNNAANVLANVENQNVGIVNSAASNNAQILNTADLANAQARQNYVGQMATLNQQIDNSKQQRKWRQIAAFNNGTQNWYRKKQMEQVLFPQVFINPITGDADFTNVGRNPLEPDMYVNPYSNAKGSDYSYADIQKATGEAYSNALQNYMKQPGMDRKSAEKLAEKHASAVQQVYMNKATKNTSPYSNFAAAMNSGATLPGNVNLTPFASSDED